MERVGDLAIKGNARHTTQSQVLTVFGCWIENLLD